MFVIVCWFFLFLFGLVWEGNVPMGSCFCCFFDQDYQLLIYLRYRGYLWPI